MPPLHVIVHAGKDVELLLHQVTRLPLYLMTRTVFINTILLRAIKYDGLRLLGLWILRCRRTERLIGAYGILASSQTPREDGLHLRVVLDESVENSASLDWS